MMKYPVALSLNTILLFTAALPSMGGKLIVNWVKGTELENVKVSNYSRNPNFKSIGIDPKKVITRYDHQRAVVAYLKTKKIKVSIHNKSAHIFLQDLVGGRSSWPTGWPINLSVCLKERPLWVEFKSREKVFAETGLTNHEKWRKITSNYKIKGLKATEGQWAGIVCRDPWEVYSSKTMFESKGFVSFNGPDDPDLLNAKKDYHIERFFDDWDMFWAKMGKKAKEKGFKTLDSYIVDEYSGYCFEEFGQPFWFHLTPQHLKFLSDSRTGPFKKLSYYAYAKTKQQQSSQQVRHQMREFSWYKDNVIKPYYENSDPQSWATRWNYIMWNIKWILIFEVWEGTSLGAEVREGRIKDLIKDRESGYPYRISFDFEGTLEEFILHTVSLYNGKSQNVYLSSGTDNLNGAVDGITIHL